MKIKLVYPKIPDNRNCPLKKCIAQNKYDGTNIHIDFDEACGAMSFGTRRDVFDLNKAGEQDFIAAHPGLESVPELVEELCFDNGLEKHLLAYKGYKEIKVFAELFGANSFAGKHNPADIKQLVIFDVMIDGKILHPDKLYKDFAQFNLAEVIYKGKYNGNLIEDIRNDHYNLNEGAVIKGVIDGKVHMVKVKTNSYMESLKMEFKDNWKDYWE